MPGPLTRYRPKTGCDAPSFGERLEAIQEVEVHLGFTLAFAPAPTVAQSQFPGFITTNVDGLAIKQGEILVI